MTEPSAQARVVLSFGGFELRPVERLLTADGAPVELGARTLDTLIVLASRPNTVIAKRDLMAEVWPDVTVEEGSLRFHIAALRKALGDGKDGARYITTLSGRGYCFVAPVKRSGDPATAHGPPTVPSPKANFLPSRLARMVGRSDIVRMLAFQLVTSRFITIVGSGGVGKTTVAVALAHDLADRFGGAVVFLELAALSDPAMVVPYLASILGLAVQSDDPTPGVTTYLRNKHLLLILDCCEHVIDGAARLASSVFLAAPHVHILATSRESLRVEGEWVHRLEPLALPPDGAALTAATALDFPATQLFVERAVAGGARPGLDDADALIVGSICRNLDGVPLAIELAAGRVAAYGLEQTAALLHQRLALQWPGKRTAPPRQKSLNATLDWSYGLLSELERAVLRRLAVFVGHFSLEAAHTVTAGATIDQILILNAIESLISKSMLSAHPVGPGMRYRLLDTTRAYILAGSLDNDERNDLATRHARYYQRWLERIATAWPSLSDAAEQASHLADLGNARSALEWCFSDHGNTDIGLNLAAAAAPVLLAMSLLTECQHWSERAIRALGDAARGGHHEMRLQATLGLSLMWTRGNTEAAYAALNRSIAIAEERGDVLNQIQLFSPLHVFRLRAGEFRTALEYAKHVSTLAQTIKDPAATALSCILLGFSLHLAGDLDGAQRELEAALRFELVEPTGSEQRSESGTMKNDAMAAPILALAMSAAASALARTLWLQGRPARALERVNQTFADATLVDHPVTRFVALTWAISVLLWNGDFDAAEEQIDHFISDAEAYSLKAQIVLGRGFKGELAISRGNMEAGIELLQGCLHDLHALRYEMLTTAFNIALARAFAATQRITQSIALIDETIRLVEVNGDLCYMPELLRVKASLLLGLSQPQDKAADAHLSQSLMLSRQQGAKAWELRTAIDIAKLMAAQGRSEEARAVLLPVVTQFVDGVQTADIMTAQTLLANLGQMAAADR